MSKLRISDTLALPVDIATQKLAWLGVTGGGKTYAAQKFAELLWGVGAQFVTLDPVGVWYGLRLADDGTRPSDITIPVFGGLHGDIPLEPTAGALLADLIVERGISAILDVSQFESDAQKARFGADFADRFYFRKKSAPSAVHLFIEEAQEFIPQNTMRGEEKMLHAFTRLQKLGRNFGIGSSLITQRPQEVNKKALNMAQTLFVFRTTGPQERKAIDSWIADKGLDQDIAGDLPKLKTGACHVWSPEFLGISETVTISRKRTFNASSTPQVGVAAKARHLAPIDIEKVRADMAATIERAKQEDPRELRARIRELERLLAVAAAHECAAGVDAGELDRAIAELEAARSANAALLAHIARADTLARDLCARAAEVAESIAAVPTEAPGDARRLVTPARDRRPTHPAVSRPVERVAAPVPTKRTPTPIACVTAPQQRILDALAWLETMRLPTPAKNIVAWLADASPTSSGFANNLGALRTAGLIDYPRPGSVSLTPAGRSAASHPDVPLVPEELHEAIYAKLTNPQRRILEVLIGAYPDPVDRTGLAEAAEASATSSGFANNLGSLRSLGLIDYPSKGLVIAQPVLFLEGQS